MVGTLCSVGDHQIRGFIFSTLDSMRIVDPRVEVRKDVTIWGCGGVVCLIYDYEVQPAGSNV